MDGQTYETYISAFQACKHSHIHPPDFYTDPEAEGSDPDDDSDQSDEGDEASMASPLADFEAFAHC